MGFLGYPLVVVELTSFLIDGSPDEGDPHDEPLLPPRVGVSPVRLRRPV